MSSAPIEIEGDWKQIIAEAALHKGNRLRLTVLPPTGKGSTPGIADPLDETASSTDHKPIEEQIAEIMSDVPDEVWAGLRPDLSDNLDHYVYGTPKRA